MAYDLTLNPPSPPPPSVLFGRLPELTFPNTGKLVVTYRLETVTGSTPTLADRGTVYFMPIRQSNLLALDRMKSKAKDLGFEDEPEQLAPTRYLWIRDVPIPASLTADIVSGSFSLEVQWQQDATILSQRNLPAQAEAIDEAQRFLQSAGLLAEDLVNGNATISFLKADINELTKTVSLSEAEFIRVDFFRSGIEDLLVYTPNPERGIVSLTFSGSRAQGKRVVELKYNYFPVNYDQSATNPVKSSLTAWNELQSGNGFIAQFDEGVSQVVVRDISLAFYDSAVPQNYLQPIYVFEGDDNFVGYVSAISSDWVE